MVDYHGTYDEDVAYCGTDRLDAEHVVVAAAKLKRQTRLQRAAKQGRPA